MQGGVPGGLQGGGHWCCRGVLHLCGGVRGGCRGGCRGGLLVLLWCLLVLWCLVVLVWGLVVLQGGVLRVVRGACGGVGEGLCDEVGDTWGL